MSSWEHGRERRGVPGSCRAGCLSAGANRSAVEAWQIWPRPLRDVSSRDLTITLLGAERPTPLLLANHGGRQIDLSVPMLAVLPDIVERVDGAVPVIVDSGIRTGADAFVALALGATAVGLGRPYAFGLAIAGQQGVELRPFRDTDGDLLARVTLGPRVPPLHPPRHSWSRRLGSRPVISLPTRRAGTVFSVVGPP